MFEGNAEEAMRFYVSVFANSRILSISRYGANEAGPEGSVFQAKLSLMGQEFVCIDSYVEHGFTFTPAISFYVPCDCESEVDRLFGVLSEGGLVLMPLAAYPFSERYGWVQDRFGVSWQLALEKGE